MTNNKQQTAVEWFAEKTFNQIELLKHLCINEEQFLNNMLFFREQAKEMEKKQIILSIAKNLPIEDGVLTAVQKADQYYEQTYGGGEQ
jgi:hypothetical protein